jgi:hypothetical protein
MRFVNGNARRPDSIIPDWNLKSILPLSGAEVGASAAKTSYFLQQ